MKLDEILCITVNTVTCVFQLNPYPENASSVSLWIDSFT